MHSGYMEESLPLIHPRHHESLKELRSQEVESRFLA